MLESATAKSASLFSRRAGSRRSPIALLFFSCKVSASQFQVYWAARDYNHKTSKTKTMSHLNPLSRNQGCRKGQALQAMKDRLETVAALPANRTCADCPEGDPSWACIVKLPTEDKKAAVLCCFQCHTLHSNLGETVSQVKSIKMAERCKSNA